jgi:hypothetical protein
METRVTALAQFVSRAISDLSKKVGQESKVLKKKATRHREYRK